MQYLLEDGVYLEVGRDKIISPSDLWSTDFIYAFHLLEAGLGKMSRPVTRDK